MSQWHVLSTDKVKEIIAQNKQGKKVASLEDYVAETQDPEKVEFKDSVGQESLTRFDAPKNKKNKNNKNKNRNRKPNHKKNEENS